MFSRLLWSFYCLGKPRPVVILLISSHSQGFVKKMFIPEFRAFSIYCFSECPEMATIIGWSRLFS